MSSQSTLSKANEVESEPMKSNLELFGSGEPMNGLLAIGCSNDDYDRYAPPLRGSMAKKPNKLSKANRTASTSQCNQNNAVRPPRPVQIAGQYVDQQNLADVTNAGNSSGAPATPARDDHAVGRKFNTGNNEGSSGINTNANTIQPSIIYINNDADSPNNSSTNSEEPLWRRST